MVHMRSSGIMAGYCSPVQIVIYGVKKEFSTQVTLAVTGGGEFHLPLQNVSVNSLLIASQLYRSGNSDAEP